MHVCMQSRIYNCKHQAVGTPTLVEPHHKHGDGGTKATDIHGSPQPRWLKHETARLPNELAGQNTEEQYQNLIQRRNYSKQTLLVQ